MRDRLYRALGENPGASPFNVVQVMGKSIQQPAVQEQQQQQQQQAPSSRERTHSGYHQVRQCGVI